MDKTQVRVIPAARDPSVHPATMTIDAIPHDLADKSADGLEARHPIEFGHSKRSVIAMSFIDPPPMLIDVRLPAASRDSWIRRHPGHQNLEVAGRQMEVEVEFA